MTTNRTSPQTTPWPNGVIAPDCPECRAPMTLVHVGRSHWAACHSHRLKICVGFNMLPVPTDACSATDPIDGYSEIL